MRFRLLLAALFLGLIPSAARSPLDREPSMAGVRLFLGPSESLPMIDVDLIARARQEIDLAAYVLTDRAVTDALQQAASRGIRLRLYLDPDQANRRSIYVKIKRSLQPPMFTDFDLADTDTTCPIRFTTTVPTQALAMMNGQLLPAITGRFSQLMLTISKAQYPDDKIEAAYMSILSRKPTAREKELWLQAQDKGLTTMEDLAFSLLNTQQFIFIQ